MSASHADPHGEQLQVLREGFRNLMSGEVDIAPYWMDYDDDRDWLVRQKPWKDILRTASIWYDYASIPQLSEGPTCNLNKEDTANAIGSIANYIDRSDYLFILTPSLMESHEESGFGHNDGEQRSSAGKANTPKIKEYSTWLKRGWCVLELFAMAMKTNSSAKACASESIIRVIKFTVRVIRDLHAKRDSS